MSNIIISSAIFLKIVLCISCDSMIIRQTRNGPVEGIEQISLLGEKFYVFRGIPYAEPPVTIDPNTGEHVNRRFKAPEPLKRNWTDNLKVHNFADSCIATTHFFQTKTKKSENCLYLNVYVPAGGRDKKTVLVWIHGGAFTEGEANDLLYGPDFLLSEDNVVVIIEYRVGIFGFLNLGFGEYTGNMGLKDQQLALKWIHKNIENFAGKKDEILLFGESAGGASVSFHMLNEDSRKYFNRAFLLSGSAFDFFALSESDHFERIQEFAKIFDREQLIEFLKIANSTDLANLHTLSSFGKTLISPWAPTIENPKTVGAFLTKPLKEIYQSNNAPVMDTMFSFTSQEYITFDPDLVQSIKPLIELDSKESTLILPFHGFTENAYPIEYQKALEKLRKAYYSDPNTSDVIKRGNIGLLSDLNFRYGILKNVIHQTRANNNGKNKTNHRNTFLSRFSANTELNLFKVLKPIKFDGAAHGEDLCYFLHCQLLDGFNAYENHLLSNKNESNVVYRIFRRMVKMITNFARTGNPSIDNDIQFTSCKSPSEIFCQEITNADETSVTTDILNQLHYDTWNEIEKMYKRLRSVPQECQGTCNTQGNSNE